MMFHQKDCEDRSRSRLACPAETGEPNAQPLAVTRWISLTKNLSHLGPNQPARRPFPFTQILFTHKRTGYGHGAFPDRNSIGFDVALLSRQIYQLLKWNDADS